MTKFSRRQFNLGLGASMLAAPFLGLLRGGTAGAAEAGRASRLIVFFTPNGTVHQHWRPSGSGSSFSFPSGSMLEPLSAHRSNLVICDGLDFYGADNHEGGMGAMLTGGGGAGTASGGASVDQFIAERVGGDTRFPSLEFGVQTSAWGGNTQTRMSYRSAGVFVPPDDSPLSVYERMFGDIAADPGEADLRLRQRQSILDLVGGELSTLGKSVGSSEQRKLEAHLEAVREVERSLGGVATGTCDAPAPVQDLAPLANDNFPAIGKAQMDLLVLALSCGLTRVASLQWAHTVAPTVFSWLGISEGHHSLSHMDDGNTAGIADLVKAERWFAEQFAYLLDRLAETPEPDGSGSMLESSLVVWCKEMGDSRLHNCNSVPFVLAGQAGGALETGRYLRFDAAPHTKLLVSICHAMGIDTGTFGDPSYGTGPLPGLL
ncbi:DUF1552 domain-containing protein [Haliangium ochraceum]|uniref:Tat (Twin-arginine translocation) pathway signal sequence domain protein n=1 Tax=Haliangium ochraceum (strain DSM 14365 / JCM 11303 / SMP-2) TaxID=502025 RepID=D0LTX4_HALO1|nr:DUF1552 domain-containing protein [Haliangium ochraceum]ACY15818.1 protein of unknown function DUF1552 [Haliangium ochraceum DSM 14365]